MFQFRSASPHTSLATVSFRLARLWVLTAFLFTATTTSVAKATLPPADTLSDDEEPHMRLLCIGNSFSLDGTIYLPQLMYDMGIPMSNHGIWCAMYASASLEYWWEHYQSGRDIEFFLHMGGLWTPPDTCRSLRQMLQQPWDVIVLQQTSTLSDTVGTYFPYLPRLIEAIRKECPNKNVQLAWHMTWSKSPTFHAGPYDMEGWKNIANSVRQAIDSVGITTIIPVGTTIQNARQLPELNDDLLITRDGIHLLYGIGHYMSALTWFEAICKPIYGLSCLDTPPSATMRGIDSKRSPFGPITDENYRLCQQCVRNAIDSPYTILSPMDITPTLTDSIETFVATYGIDGRRIHDTPHGIYIRGGKKFIAR